MPKGKLITDPEGIYQALHRQKMSTKQPQDIELPSAPRRRVPASSILDPYKRLTGAVRTARKKVPK